MTIYDNMCVKSVNLFPIHESTEVPQMSDTTLTLVRRPVHQPAGEPHWTVIVPEDVKQVIIGRGDEAMNEVRDGVQYCFLPGKAIADQHASLEFRDDHWVVVSLVSDCATYLAFDDTTKDLEPNVGVPFKIENGYLLCIGLNGLIELTLS